jgi:selenium metabolism protein YedF
MGEEKLDCRSLACPSPVLKTKEMIDQGNVNHLTILVDNPAAKENVSRFLTRSGYEVSISEEEGVFTVTGFRPQMASSECEVFVEQQVTEQKKKILVLIGTNLLGRGDDELGRKLMINFIGTLKEMGEELWRLVLVNGGVKLAIEGSEALPTLQDLEKEGVDLLVCGTCLNHFGILEQKRVGEVTNMLDIVTALQLADKVINMT